MSGLLRLLQGSADHQHGTLLSVTTNEALEPRARHRITLEDANDLLSRGLAEWIAMPAALQESRLVQLESLTKKLSASLEEAQARLADQAQQLAALLRHFGLQLELMPEVTHAAEQA